jgi:hypothetical protein
MIMLNHVQVQKDYPEKSGPFQGPDLCSLLILLPRCVPVGTTINKNKGLGNIA